MTAEARISTPVYLDPKLGKHCGSCAKCDIENPFNPTGFGLCGPHDNVVNIRRKTDCKQYQPREVEHHDN